MQIRVLKPEDQSLLEKTPQKDFDLKANVVLGAFDEKGQLVGTMGLVIIPHVEGTWVREEARGGTVLHRLEKAALEHAREEYGITRLFGFSMDAAMAEYAARSGWTRKDWTVWEKET